ncbi:hypothetical protein GIY23_08410 [Allosaccharopolyspora coralli]|uniref:STAS domain-containing protein n=1 Tax=Allosaccharopolyspora coralli TaxID=2665642 RepID=A0A5Q3Q8L4_9PSEU|nr:STAS domain-containing protein [Allosaccharopolyspora coralli]QGK69544.1 hypothetical protein GIY23_08410 [Allosaccharopolyspora coralli]
MRTSPLRSRGSAGDLDFSTVELFSARCEREFDSDLVVVELRTAHFVALCGALTLENLGRRAQAHGSRFRIALGGGVTFRALEVAGTTERCVCVTPRRAGAPRLRAGVVG